MKTERNEPNGGPQNEKAVEFMAGEGLWNDLNPGAQMASIFEFPSDGHEHGEVTFIKPDYADPFEPVNQDRITDNVWLTRGGAGWLFNANDENMHSDDSPSGTRWAFGATDTHFEIETMAIYEVLY